MNDPAEMLFDTDRVIVRRLGAADEDAMYSVYSDPIAARWVEDGLPIKREECVKWIEVTQSNYEMRGYGMAAVEWKATGKVIGFVGLVHPGRQKEAEVKYSFLREYWGRGIATETVRGMLTFGREKMGLSYIMATLSPENVASQRVLEKAGLSFEQDRRDEDGEITRVMGGVL